MSVKSTEVDRSVAAHLDWDAVHFTVQSALTRLAVRLIERVPAVEIMGARTSGKAFFLHSYRRVTPSTADGEAIVIGISFLPRGDLIVAEGDIVGEETGRIHFTAPSTRVIRPAQDEVNSAARTLAEELANQAGLLIPILAGGAT